MTEYHYGYSKPTRPGRVVFRLENAGRENHGLTLLPLTSDVPPIDQQLRGNVRRLLSHKADVQVAIGESATFAVDLPRGRYAIVCFVVSPDGVSNSVKGMNSEFTIG